uniref:Uncharacterized protein n=1 Tax=Desulfacinum infernum TaxID=35837 RepID=A0A832A8M1_9BACT
MGGGAVALDPGLRPGLECCAPSGLWQGVLSRPFGAMGAGAFWALRGCGGGCLLGPSGHGRRGATRSGRRHRPEGAKHPSPGRSPGSGRPYQIKIKPQRGETHL